LTREQTKGLRVHTKGEAKLLKEAAIGQARISRTQKMAQEWVESPFTEFLILILLVLDLALTIYEIYNPSPVELAHVDNPLMVMTGGILFVFFFESLIRVLGYRWSMVNGTRMLDLIDSTVVFISIVVYIFTIATDATKVAKLITFARIIRFLRILKFARRIRKLVSFNKYA
jgi:hypothetical protein